MIVEGDLYTLYPSFESKDKTCAKNQLLDRLNQDGDWAELPLLAAT